jgi:NTE family protein
MAATRQPVDLVFEGGGVKGIGLAGAVETLEEQGYEPHRVAGTSAGAVVAALLAAEYEAAELRELVLSLDYWQFQDRAWEDKVPLIERSLSLLLDLGLFEGERLHAFMRELLAAKGIRRFGDLELPHVSDPSLRSRLQVIASDVTTRRLLVLPRDAQVLGIEPDELEVALAVRMSASIPIFFEPVRFENPKTGETHLIVDGGMLSNFPVWLFDSADDVRPVRPTFGLLLVEPEPSVPVGERLAAARMIGHGPRAVIDYLKALAETVMEGHDRLYVEQESFARTIPIPTLGIRTTEFDLSPARALALYESGRRAAVEFLARWDFEAYVAEFRCGRPHSRRAQVAAAMRDEPAR